MINKKILFGLVLVVLFFSSVTYSSAQTSAIPSWIKNIAGFWANDQIADQDFLGAIQYLIDHQMLQVSSLPSKSADVMLSQESQDIETPIQEEIEGFSDLDLVTFKVVQLQELVAHPDIVKAVINSNAEFAAMDDPYQYITDKDTEWKKQPKNKNSPFMNVLIENKVANILKTKSVIPTEEFGDVLFPELIVTNAYGANVGISTRTEDYNQGDEIWWIKAKDRSVQFRDTMWDESAKIFSADIIVTIVDENGYFIGVLNAATPVR